VRDEVYWKWCPAMFLLGRSILSELKMRKKTSLPEVFHFKPSPLSHVCSVVYNKSSSTLDFATFRRHLHQLFLIPVDRPLFRRMNEYKFEDDRLKKGPLMNVHKFVKMGGVENMDVSLLKGDYTYHHYMQDQFDDDGWGCAYRSLQTVISWFRRQVRANYRHWLLMDSLIGLHGDGHSHARADPEVSGGHR